MEVTECPASTLITRDLNVNKETETLERLRVGYEENGGGVVEGRGLEGEDVPVGLLEEGEQLVAAICKWRGRELRVRDP